jgi:hypothetical protein
MAAAAVLIAADALLPSILAILTDVSSHMPTALVAPTVFLAPALPLAFASLSAFRTAGQQVGTALRTFALKFYILK